MAERLVDIYDVAVAVEVFFAGEGEAEWRPGVVVALQHPGVWVRTMADGGVWFVTNGRRIRPVQANHPAAGDEPG